jgi:hypothetical protein
MKKILSYIPVLGYIYLNIYYFIKWETPFKCSTKELFYWGMYQLYCIVLVFILMMIFYW